MKLKILKNCKLAQKPWMPHLCFRINEIVDIEDKEVAEWLLKLNYAKKEIENIQKKSMPNDYENKMIDTNTLENKSILSKVRGRHKKVNKED